MKTITQLQNQISRYESRVLELNQKEVWDDEVRSTAASLEKDLLAAKQRLRLLQEVEQPVEVESDHPKKEVKLRNYLNATVSGTALTGAEKELDEELGFANDGCYLPLEVLFSDTEVRADVVSPSPSSISKSVAAAIPRIFPSSVARFLGVSMKTVPPGERSFVVVDSGATASAQAEGSTVSSVAASYDTFDLRPKRLAARFSFTQESMARYSSLESVLRRDLQAAMTHGVDQAVLYGAGSGAEIGGFLSPTAGTGLPTVTSKFTVAGNSWSESVGLVGKSLDGIYSESFNQCRFLVGPATATALASVFQSGTGISAYDYIASKCQVRVSDHIAAAASNSQAGVLYRSKYPMTSILASWAGIRMIRDHYTSSSSAVTHITAHMLYNFAILRPDSGSRLKFNSV